MLPGRNMASSTGGNWRPPQRLCVIEPLFVNCSCRLWLAWTSGWSGLYLCSFTSTNNAATATAAGLITLPHSHMTVTIAIMLQCTQITLQPYHSSDTTEMWCLFQIRPKFHSSQILARFQINSHSRITINLIYSHVRCLYKIINNNSQ